VVPDNLRFGGGVSGTFLNPAVAVILLLTGVLICLLPQRKVLIPFLLTAFLIPADQIIVVAGLHFSVLRVLIFFGMIRIFLLKGRGQWNIFSGGMNKVDKAMVALSIASAVAGILLFRNGQAFVFELGEIYTAFGSYFLLRCLVRDQDDVIRLIRTFAVIVVMLGGVMVFEHLAGGRNPYALLAGAKARYFAMDLGRDGKIRATASFGTPILAGIFGAVSLPLFVGLWLVDKKRRLVAVVGMAGATVMTVASHSSTPVMGYMACLLGLCIWPIRRMTRAIRWGIVITLVALQMVMKSPVYGLITRIDISGSSYHRFALIDQTVRHFWDWWLLGTKSNVDWGWDMWDTSNQFVLSAISGGLLGLILFIAIIVFGFKSLGRAREAAAEKKQKLFLWAIGAALLAYTISFFGISLWDQSIVEWYALLAIIAAVAVPRTQAQLAEEPVSTVLYRGMAAKIQPAYSVRSDPRLLGDKSLRSDREPPLHRRHKKEF
jgi:hypothetical protein